jgi:hypothetical protein
LPAQVIGEPQDAVFHPWEAARSQGAGGSRSPGLGTPGREGRIELGLIGRERIWPTALGEHQAGQQDG